MSGWKIIVSPSLDLLNKLLEDSKRKVCPDCGVKSGERHNECCDVARCTICGCQRLSCECLDGDNDIFEGYWPGSKECYDKKYVATFEGYTTLDYNRLYAERKESIDSLEDATNYLNNE